MRTIKYFTYSSSFIIIFSVLFLFQCTHEEDNDESGEFDIYLIQNMQLSPLEFKEIPIEEIELPKNPVATLDDIDTYKIFHSDSGLSLVHSIIFKSEIKEKFGDKNCFFMLVADNIRMYDGEYWANFMDTYPSSVVIYAYTYSEFHIMAHEDGRDKINDSRIINVLIDSGVNVTYVNIGTE